MRKFGFNKLVRDKIVSSVKANGGIPHYRTLDEAEYISELKKKVIEEAEEFRIQAEEDPLDTVLDIQDVLDSLIHALGKSKEDIARLRKEKLLKNGGFSNRDYLEYVEVPEHNKWIAYYEKYPEKYPEIT